jgi:membrane protein DedA with SNARE-associated domain
VDFWRGWPYPVAVATLFMVALLRAGATYALGRAAQTGARRTRIARLMARPGFARVQDLVARWGAPLVTASFLTVGIQTLVNLIAGMTQMPLRRYIPALALGSLLWGFLYATVGLATFSAWRELYERFPTTTVVVTLLLLGGLAAYVLRQVRQVRQRQSDRLDANAR